MFFAHLSYPWVLVVRWLEKVPNIFSEKWWFDGDESHGQIKNHLQKIQVKIYLSTPKPWKNEDFRPQNKGESTPKNEGLLGSHGTLLNSPKL